ncbi:MAG: hypothetical protein WCO23_02500 [bacterium]
MIKYEYFEKVGIRIGKITKDTSGTESVTIGDKTYTFESNFLLVSARKLK